MNLRTKAKVLKKENESLNKQLKILDSTISEGMKYQEHLKCKIQLYQKAIDTYGLENQTMMVFEEMAELQKELCKALRGMIVTKKIAEEIADVEIMLEQMKEYYKLYLMVEEIKISKLNRLENNLEILNPRCYSSI